jgi:hypothetical protein
LAGASQVRGGQLPAAQQLRRARIDQGGVRVPDGRSATVVLTAPPRFSTRSRAARTNAWTSSGRRGVSSRIRAPSAARCAARSSSPSSVSSSTPSGSVRTSRLASQAARVGLRSAMIATGSGRITALGGPRHLIAASRELAGG